MSICINPLLSRYPWEWLVCAFLKNLYDFVITSLWNERTVHLHDVYFSRCCPHRKLFCMTSDDLFFVLMHGVALLDRWRGLVFALHVTFLPTDSSDACSVAPCSLLIIKLLLLHHTHPNHHISGTSRRALRLSGISATVLSLACRCGCCFSASVLLLSFDYRIGISVFLGSIRDFNGIRMYVPYIYKPA